MSPAHRLGRSLARIDWLLLLSAAATAGLGLLYLASAGPGHFSAQCVWATVGLLALLVTVMVGYEPLIRYAGLMYLGVLVLLVVVFFLPAHRHAHSWIRLWGFSVQPSELAKIAVVLMLARHLRYKEDQATLKGLLFPAVLVLLPMALILRQPDLGTAALLLPVLVAVLFASGARKAHLAGNILFGAAATVPMWIYLLRPYQKRRILAFLHPQRYEVREAYQLIMSRIAVGSGGLTGAGWGQGRSNSLGLVPDRHTDFIFCVIAEEGGFLRAGLLIALYAVLTLLGLHAAAATRDPGGRLVAVGAATMIGVQAAINIAVTLGLLPTTGITLPLVSYGGSSFLATSVLLGLILSVGATTPPVLHGETFTGTPPGELPTRTRRGER